MRLPSLPAFVVLTALLTACPDDGTGDGDTAAVTDGSMTGGSMTGGASETAADETAGVDPDGQMLFVALCGACHGPQGEGTPLGYELRHPVRVFTTWVVRNGRPGLEFEGSVMAAYTEAVIDDAQLESIWDYLDSFPQPTTGEGLYLDYCRNCHGVDGAGGTVQVDIRGRSRGDISEKVREGENLGDPGARTQYMPALLAEVITDDEIGLLAEYIGTL